MGFIDRTLPLLTLVSLLAQPAVAATSLAPSSVSVSVGSTNASVKNLAAADGKYLSLYTNGKGNLTALVNFSVSSLGSGASVAGVFREHTASDSFAVAVKTTSGAFVSIGAVSGSKASRSMSFALPANVVVGGAVTLQISAANADDLDIDQLVLSSSGSVTPPPTPTPVSTPKPTPTPSPTPKPTPTATPPPSTGGIKLPPAGKVAWDWQIGATNDTNIVPPPGNRLMDVDGFNTSSAEVAALKAQGIYTVCYIDAGSWEAGRPDSADYPAYLKIYYDKTWDEYFLDVTDVFKPNSVLAHLLKARLQMCKDKGFDALEPDNLQNDENAGGKITVQQQLDFNGWIADAAHAVGLAVLQKNGPDKVLEKNSQGVMMVDKFDGMLNEQCEEYNECSGLTPYVQKGKLVLDAEYNKAPNCSTSDSLNINIIEKDLELTGGNQKGYKHTACP